jgi:phosphoglycerate dehydrogenase-like enzyme
MIQSSKKVVVTTRAFSKNPFLREELLKYFPNALFNIQGKKLLGKELVDFIQDADGVIIGLEPINENLLALCPTIKIVAKYGVGLDNINIDDCRKNQVEIGWEGGVNRLSVAEMTLSFMLGLSRNIYKTSNQLKSGVWNKDGGFQLSGKTIGIIGVGNIGKELIRLLKPFSCNILVNDIIDQKDYYNQNKLIETPKEELIKQSDIVTVHTPLNQEMEGFFDLDTFKLFKKSGYFINTARGGIVNQNDLKQALQKGIISGAAIDVYEEEPITDMEVLSIPTLINTPHIGGNTEEAVIAMGMSAIKHLRAYFNN